jgi:hypothetical protein
MLLITLNSCLLHIFCLSRDLDGWRKPPIIQCYFVIALQEWHSTAMDHAITATNCPKLASQFSHLGYSTRLRKFSHPGRLSHQKWCVDTARGYGFRGMFYLILTTFSCLLLALAGANSGCDQPIDDRKLLGLCFPFLRQNGAQAWWSQVCLRHQRR